VKDYRNQAGNRMKAMHATHRLSFTRPLPDSCPKPSRLPPYRPQQGFLLNAFVRNKTKDDQEMA